MRRISWLLLLTTVIIIGGWYLQKQVFFSVQRPEIIGGINFNLLNQDGQHIGTKDMLGKYTVIFFGFSRCPHICPTQLAKISAILEEVNSKGLQAFFITIDPSNDTVEKLKVFHEQFDPRIQMLTAPQEEIERVVNSYKVYASFSEDPDKINHSSILYVMGKDGKYLDHLNIASHEVDETVAYIKKIVL